MLQERGNFTELLHAVFHLRDELWSRLNPEASAVVKQG